MPYLQHEKTRLETENQRATEELASLNSRLQTQQQAIEAAKVRVQAAQNRLTAAKAAIPGLETAAATADQRVADLDLVIEEHLRREPEPTIETEHGPRPNPAHIQWSLQLKKLTDQRDQAQADAATAHKRLNDARAQVSQATTEVQNAERQLTDATSAGAAIQQAIEAARGRQQAAQKELALLGRWNEEISRDPLDRKTLEQVAVELSDRAAVLQDAYALARVQNEIANETLTSLSARRAQLTAALSQVNAKLPAALEELRAARAALTEAIRRI
jgi:chromosome segregation ATPase